MASVTKIGEASLGRWEAGSMIQGLAYDQFLFLLQHAENMERLQQRGIPKKQDVVKPKQNWSFKLTTKILSDQSNFLLNQTVTEV